MDYRCSHGVFACWEIRVHKYRINMFRYVVVHTDEWQIKRKNNDKVSMLRSNAPCYSVLYKSLEQHCINEHHYFIYYLICWCFNNGGGVCWLTHQSKISDTSSARLRSDYCEGLCIWWQGHPRRDHSYQDINVSLWDEISICDSIWFCSNCSMQVYTRHASANNCAFSSMLLDM